MTKSKAELKRIAKEKGYTVVNVLGNPHIVLPYTVVGKEFDTKHGQDDKRAVPLTERLIESLPDLNRKEEEVCQNEPSSDSSDALQAPESSLPESSIPQSEPLSSEQSSS